MSTHDRSPESAWNTVAPTSKLSILVIPVFQSETIAPEFAEKPPSNVEVEVVEYALKFAPTTVPCTASRAYGDDVPIPTFPFESIMNAAIDEVANVEGDAVAK